jgi:hypothetical protein
MLPYLFVVIAFLWRVMPWSVVPHLNFAPLLAALLFFGAYADRKRIWFPLALLVVCDVALNRAYGYPFTADLPITWVWYAAMLLFGGLLRQERPPAKIALIAISGSISFFVISNFAVWLVWNMYPMTWAGLAACYDAGLPFFRNTFAGDMLFTAIFFSVPVILKLRQKSGGHFLDPSAQ